MNFLYGALLLLALAPSALAVKNTTDKYQLSFENKSLIAHIQFHDRLQVRQEAKMKLEFFSSETQQLINIKHDVKIVLNMPSMGHGSNPTEIIPALNKNGDSIRGTFEVSHINFFMEGLWLVEIHLTSPGGELEIQSFEVIL